MTLQVLVSTMHQRNHELLEKMNIQTDAIVINQCDRNEVENFEYNGHAIVWISTDERGVGRSRNRAILASTADILLFADDDVVYTDDMPTKVLNFFSENPYVDLTVFNLHSLNPDRPEAIVDKKHRLHQYNCLKFGAFRIAVKRKSLLKKNVFFSLLFGGGAAYKAGEDNLFITQCLQKHLSGYASNLDIGTVAQAQSTWFCGYDDQYFMDRGALFAALYGKTAKMMLFLFELRHFNKSFFKRFALGLHGIHQYNF